jgi:lipoprotein-releasing system ATP-binding protein
MNERIDNQQASAATLQQSTTPNEKHQTVLACEDLSRSFEEGGRTLHVLRGVNIQVQAGESLAVIGESGAGKTTLLQLLGGLDLPTSGRVYVQGQDIASMNGSERGILRNQSLGFVYQFHHLLPEFSALENVAMPLLLRSDSVAETRARAVDVLQRVGLGDRLNHRPGELSGGERQRAAVARALVTRPAVVLADEPTGNLDHRTGEQVFQLMLELRQEFGSSLIIVTHDMQLAGRMDRIVRLRDGQLLDD